MTLSYIQPNTQMKMVLSYNGSSSLPINHNFTSFWVYWFTDSYNWQTPVNATFVAGTTPYGPSVYAYINVTTVVMEAEFFILANLNDGTSYWIGNSTSNQSYLRALSVNTNTKNFVVFDYAPNNVTIPTPFFNGTIRVDDTFIFNYNASRLRQLGCSGRMFSIAFVNFTNIYGEDILDLRFSSQNDAGLLCYIRVPPNAVNVSIGVNGCDWDTYLNSTIHDGPFYFPISATIISATSTSSATSVTSSSSATSSSSSATSSSSTATSSSSSSSTKSSSGTTTKTNTNNGMLLFPVTVIFTLLLSMI